jgi:DNA polymerase III delta prime subunit
VARMIPPQISAKAPKGEQLIFRKLRDDPRSRDWIVFHSFDIRRHSVRIEGEADLVVAVPGLGVLCIEVKGCGVSRHDGLWTYEYDPPRTSPVGPFRQASDASHSLRDYLFRRDASLAPLVFYSAVIFTEIEFDERSLEWDPWQVITKSTLLRNPISRVIERILESAHSKLAAIRPKLSWYGERSRPTAKHLESMSALMRGDFEYAAIGGIDLDVAEESIRRFTEEQFDALDLLAENHRVLFKGPAGTGKTLLAIEAARRAVRAGKSTILVCFNNLLGSWLKRETAMICEEARALGVSFQVGTLSGLMLGLQKSAVPDSPDSDFWAVGLPLLATEALLTGDSSLPAHDVLIIDEAQDLLSDAMLDVLELVTRGGLSAGRWAIFGDFERQAIYAGLDGQSGLDRLRSRAGANFTTSPLRINCRNSPRIAEAVTLTSGLAPGYSRVLAETESSDVEPVFYKSVSHQVEQLATTLKHLLKKFPPDQIVVLSTRADVSSCAAGLAASNRELGLAPYKGDACSAIGVRYASVHSFKGLEAAAIVLTDIDSVDDAHGKSLLYVGMTRARHSLTMLINDRARGHYDRMLMDGYKTLMRKGSR